MTTSNLVIAMLLLIVCTTAFRIHDGGSTIARSMVSFRRSAVMLLGGEDSSTHLHSAQLAFPVWLAEVFKGQSISALYVDPKQIDAILNTDADMGCIINRPSHTMAHPMIDFDIDKATLQVLDVSHKSPDPRFKPVVAIARGMGGGKTRVMEEIRRRLLLRKGILPIGITFNNDSEFSSDPWLRPEYRKAHLQSEEITYEELYALSVSARVLHAIFGLTFLDAGSLIKKKLHRLDWNSVNAVTMIRETLKFATHRVNEARDASSITHVDTVVLLMDESRKADEFLNDEDLGRFVREALLNKELDFHAALVISDLGFLPESLRTPTSFREVVVLELPARLSPKKILSSWWFPRGELEILTPEQQNFFELVAASINNMPRAVEIAADFLQVETNKEELTKPTFFKRLFEHIIKVTSSKYYPTALPDSVLFAAFLREEVPLDKQLLDSFMNSVVTNPLSKAAFRKGSSVLPDVSMVLLKVLADDLNSTFKGEIKKKNQLVGESVQEVLDTMSLSHRNTGDVLETSFLQALRVRLVLASSAKDMTIARLCGLSKVFGNEEAVEELKLFWSEDVNAATAEALFAFLGTKRYAGQVDVLHHDSHEEAEAFLAELDGLQVSEQLPVRILRPHKQEAWDVCVVSNNAATKKPFYVFFDCKSGAEFADFQSNKRILNDFANPSQYRHTKAMMGSSRDFLFVYLSTHKNLKTIAVPVENEEDKDRASRCVFLDRYSTLELLGPFSEIYRVARSSYSNSLGSTSGEG